MDEGKKIVVLGGGFGGVRAALDLRRKLPKAQITLVNQTPYHTYIPDLYEVATAVLHQERKIDFIHLEGTVNIPLINIFKGKRVEVVIDGVNGVDLEKKEVSTADHGKLPYDFLVIALGSTTSYFNIEGAWENSHPLKVLEDALNVRNDLSEAVTRVKGDEKVEVVIAGGGFTGVELAGALNKVLKKKGRVTILEASDTVLAGMPQWAQQRTLKKLKRGRVKVKLGCGISKVLPKEVICATGEKISYDYLVWTTGVKAIELRSGIKNQEPEEGKVALFNKKGQIITQADLSIEDHPEVFVVGDIAGIMDEKKERNIVPTTAWAAIDEAKIAALNIQKRLHQKATTPYKPPHPAFIVPVGKKYALSNAFNLRFKGVIAWCMKLYASLRYLKSILPLFQALRVWIQGVEIYSTEVTR